MAQGGEKKMLVGVKGVKYGLQMPKAETGGREQSSKKTLGMFSGGGSSSDEEDVAAQVAAHQAKKLKDAKIAAEHAAALAEDSNVYEYDGVYEQMHKAKEEPKKLEQRQRKPKYIAALVETAALRKKEQDVSFDRITIKERKKEDHLFGDKEVFVTSSYKKKLLEDEVWMEEQRKREEIEAKVDVTKRKDLSDFYRNFYTSNSGFGSDQVPDEGHLEPERQDDPQVRSGSRDSMEEAEESVQQGKSSGVEQVEQLSAYEKLRMRAEHAGIGTGGKGDGSKGEVGRGNPSGSASLELGEDSKSGSAHEKPVKDGSEERSKEDKVAEARARFLARKRKNVGD